MYDMILVKPSYDFDISQRSVSKQKQLVLRNFRGISPPFLRISELDNPTAGFGGIETVRKIDQ